MDFISRAAVMKLVYLPSKAAKLAHAIGGEIGKELLEKIINNAPYESARKSASNIMNTVLQSDRIIRLHGPCVHFNFRSEIMCICC